jgi:hypothetical protein
MHETPNKGPIRRLKKHILKHDETHNLTSIVDQAQ